MAEAISMLRAMGMGDEKLAEGFFDPIVKNQMFLGQANQANALADEHRFEIQKAILANQLAPIALQGDQNALNALAGLDEKAYEAIRNHLVQRDMAQLVPIAMTHKDPLIRNQAWARIAAIDPSAMGAIGNMLQINEKQQQKQDIDQWMKSGGSEEIANAVKAFASARGFKEEDLAMITPDAVASFYRANPGGDIFKMFDSNPRGEGLAGSIITGLGVKEDLRVEEDAAKKMSQEMDARQAQIDSAVSIMDFMEDLGDLPDNAFTFTANMAQVADSVTAASGALRDALFQQENKYGTDMGKGRVLGENPDAMPLAEAEERLANMIEADSQKGAGGYLNTFMSNVRGLSGNLAQAKSLFLSLALAYASAIGLGGGRSLTDRDLKMALEAVGSSTLNSPTQLRNSLIAVLKSSRSRLKTALSAANRDARIAAGMTSGRNINTAKAASIAESAGSALTRLEGMLNELQAGRRPKPKQEDEATELGVPDAEEIKFIP